HLGKLLTALTELQTAARLFKLHDSLIQFAKDRAAALQQRIPKLVIRPAATMPRGSTFQRDGLALDPASIGKAVAVDPGEHVIIGSAPGRAQGGVVVTVIEG